MATFGNKDELRDFLTKINPLYGAYSSALYQAGVNDTSIIGNSHVDYLTSLSIATLHATDLIAKCKTIGKASFPKGSCFFCLESRHLALSFSSVYNGVQVEMFPACTLEFDKVGAYMICLECVRVYCSPQCLCLCLSVLIFSCPLTSF